MNSGFRQQRSAGGAYAVRRLRPAAADLGLQDFCDELVERPAHDSEDDVALLAVRLHSEDRPRPLQAGPQRLPADLAEQAPSTL